jgi:hypothetical protein
MKVETHIVAKMLTIDIPKTLMIFETYLHRVC